MTTPPIKINRRQTLVAFAGASVTAMGPASAADKSTEGLAPPSVGAAQSSSASGAYYACALQFRVDAVNRDTSALTSSWSSCPNTP